MNTTGPEDESDSEGGTPDVRPMTTDTTPDKAQLPELPEPAYAPSLYPVRPREYSYTADQMHEYAQAYAAALTSSPSAQSAWQLIETAPTGQAHSPPLHAIVASPLEDGSLHVEEAWWDFERREWWPANVDHTDAYGELVYPTHWMPLPSAPTTGEQA